MQTMRNQISSWFAEAFQNAPTASKIAGPTTVSNIGPTKQSITTFFTWWTSLPEEFPKSKDILLILKKWEPYTSTKAPYILPTFASLDATNYQSMRTDFSNIYALSLVDAYAALRKRHTTKPPTPLPRLTTESKSPATDRELIAKGDSSLPPIFQTSYYPSLYVGIRSQLLNVFSILAAVLTRVSKEEQEVSTRLLPKWKEDRIAVQKMPPQSAKVFKDILTLSEKYVDYIRRARQYLPFGEKYQAVETSFRATLQKRIDLFLEYCVENITRDGETPVARAGLSIPPEISKLPTSLPLASLPLLNLLGIEASYFGKEGVEVKAKDLLSKAILELRRDAVESLLRSFQQTYKDFSLYCNPAEYPKEVQDANTLLPTYWQTTRQKAFDALPLGVDADFTAEKEINSLIALEGSFLRALQVLVRNTVDCFGKVVAEKGGLKRPWSPPPSVVARFDSPPVIPKQLDLVSLGDLRDSYMQVWGFVETAARQQVANQYAAYRDLQTLGEIVGIELPPKPTEPTREIPLFNLQAIYNQCDQAGQRILASLQDWIESRLRSHSKLYERYQVFRRQAEVQALYIPTTLEDVVGQNTTEQDIQTLKSYTFYTPKVSQELNHWMVKYTAEPAGLFAQLRIFVRGELAEFVRAFKSQWDSFGVKPYPTYAGDSKLLATDMKADVLETMMDRYMQYVIKTTAMEGLQEFSAAQRDLQTQYDLFRGLYGPNRSWLPALPAAVQVVADSYESDGAMLGSVRSLQALGPLLKKYTAAVRGMWLHLEASLPKLVFTPYTMLLAEYEIFLACGGSTRPLPVESIEKERLLFKSFLEPSTALVSWLNRFRTSVWEGAFPKLQAFVVEELQAYARSVPNPPTLYLSTPYELRDSLHNISISLSQRDVAATKSRAFQQASAFLKLYDTTEGQFSLEIGELYENVQTTLSRIQETEDVAYILTQDAVYRRGVLELMGFQAVRAIMDALQKTEYLAAFAAMQKTGREMSPPETAADFVATCKKFLATVWKEYQSSTSRTRDYILTLDSYEKDRNTSETDVKSWIALGKQYADHAILLDLANRQESVLVLMDQFKEGLYGPFANFLALPFPLVKLAFATDGNRWTAKRKPGSIEDVAEIQKSLGELAKTYTDAIQECLPFIQKSLQTHLKTYGNLYDAYVEFDAAYSQYFDVEPIPASLQNKSGDDLAALQALSNELTPAIQQTLNDIRIKYFFFPETSDFPTLVRFVKLQLQLYLQHYISVYDELETALQPPKLAVPTLMTKVRPAVYRGLEDLQDLLEVVGQLKKGSDELQTAKVLQTKKETTRTLLDSLEELMDLFREQLEYKQFAKLDINVPQMRIDLQYTNKKEEIDEKYERIGVAMATLASDALRQFNTTYNKNVELRSYFYRNAVEVLNAFTLYFPQDVESVSTNTVAENLALARRYVGYTKIVLEAQPAAAVAQDTTQAYRSATLRILDRVEGIQEQLKKYRDLSGGTWDISGARAVLASATFVHEMEPTRKAYERTLQEQESKVLRYTQQSMNVWMQLYESIDPFQKYLPPSQQAIAERKESTEDKSVEVLLNLANKYNRYRLELQKYISPNSPFFSKVRLDVQESIDTYSDHLQQVQDLSGVLPPTTLDFQQDKKIVSTATLPVLQRLSRQYMTADVSLLAAVSDFAARVLQDQFLMNNRTLDVPEYTVPRERAETLLSLLKTRTIPLSSVLVEIRKYGSLLARLDTALLRQEVLQLIDQMDAEADEIELLDPSVAVPSWEAERLRVASLTETVELEKARAVLVSYRQSMQSQITAAVEKEMREFEALYKEVLRDGTISEYGGEFLKAYTALDTTRKEIRAGASLQRRADIRKHYAKIVLNAKTLRSNVLSKRDQEAKAAWKENQAKRLETSAAMERFLKAYASYTSSAYPPKFRKAIGQTTADLDRIQKSTSRAELQELLIKYLTLMRDFQQFLEEDQAKRSEQVGLLIQRFKSMYLPHIPTLHTFPSYLRLDVRMIDRDLGTLQGAPDIAVVASLEQEYEAYMAALTKYLGEMGVRVGHRLNEKKQAVRALIQELNDAGVKQARVFQFFPVEVQRKFRAIPADLEYLKNPTLTAAELEEMEREYKGLLEKLRAALVDVDAEEANAALLPSLRHVQDLFRERYATIDASRIPPKDMPFFQELLRGLSNPVSSEQAEQALAAYRQGLQRLQALPTTQERRIPNTPFDQLQEAIGFFQKEYGIRDVSSLIQNDRLLLNSLQNDAASYIRLYKTPPPNMRNYAEIVQQVAKQYWDGVRILRTYALR